MHNFRLLSSIDDTQYVITVFPNILKSSIHKDSIFDVNQRIVQQVWAMMPLSQVLLAHRYLPKTSQSTMYLVPVVVHALNNGYYLHLYISGFILAFIKALLQNYITYHQNQTDTKRCGCKVEKYLAAEQKCFLCSQSPRK